jgi:2-dehydro-3-deoxyglucarate aldolase
MQQEEYFRKSIQESAKNGKPLLGTIQTLNSTEVTEILATAGYDWIFVDLEHSPLDIGAAQRILQAATPHTPCVLRSPSHEEMWIKKLLDIGPAGLIIPQVKNAEEAARIVQYSKYPPEGKRSVGISRAHGYGASFQRYIENANRETALILQIEHIDAVKDIEAIVNVPGIDVLFVGPYDLSGSMGKLGQVNHPDVQEQIERVRQVCVKAGMALGIFTVSPEEVKVFAGRGFTLIALGIDVMTLSDSVSCTIQNAKK